MKMLPLEKGLGDYYPNVERATVPDLIYGLQNLVAETFKDVTNPG